MNSDLKIQALMEKHGLEGYALWCMCLELLGRESKNCKIKLEHGWTKALQRMSELQAEKIQKITETFAELHLIDRRNFKNGALFIPKFHERIDDYSKKKLRKMSGQCTDIVRTNIPTRSKKKEVRSKKEEKEKNKPLSCPLFEELWEKYPNKDGKKGAIRYFESSVKTEKDKQDIRIALDNYLNSERVLKGFIKNGSTWFNNWQDWIEVKNEPKEKAWGIGA